MANSKDQEEEILEEEYKRLLQNLNKYQHENQQVLVQQQAPGKEFCVENRDLLKDRVWTLEEHHKHYDLQESAATEALIMGMYHNAGKFPWLELFHNKK